MKFSIETSDLVAGISTVTKAMAVKSTLSILEGIYMMATNDTLLLRCTDLSIQIETTLPAAVSEEGSFVLPGRLFSEMVRKLPDETTFFDVSKDTATIESGRFKTTLQGNQGSDFQTMADVSRDAVITIKPDALKRMIRGCIFAAAQDDSKPILMGALMETDGKSATIVALDGFRLALRSEQIESIKGDACRMVIPARSLIEISRILPDEGEPISLVFSKTHIKADVGSTSLTARLMEGEFIKYSQILPDSHTSRVRVSRRELQDGIDRVALMARENKSNLIKFSISQTAIVISANSEIGRSTEEIEAGNMGEDMEIAFNARYFTDVLKVIDDEEIFLDLNNNISPCVVKPIQGEAFYYLILPVRLFTGM